MVAWGPAECKRLVGRPGRVFKASPTAALAEFAADLSWNQLPQRVSDRAKDLILDALADALLGWKTS